MGECVGVQFSTGLKPRGRLLRTAMLASTALVMTGASALAVDATWLLNPASGDYNSGSNWSTGQEPVASIATFGTSNVTSISIGIAVSDGWKFNAGASAYTFSNNLILQFFGSGIVINGGSATITNVNSMTFQASSTAGSATIINDPGGLLSFENNSTAGSATITNNDLVIFKQTSTAGTARLINGAGGTILLSSFTGAGITAGSIEGGGTISLSGRNLAVGSNNLSTAFSGIIADGGSSLTKTGSGTLTLSGANTYSGGTTINGGLVNFTAGNNLGTGNVTLSGGGLQWASGNTLDISGRLNALGAGGATFDTNGNNVTLASVLTGGALTKAGAGALTLSGANTYSGATTVSSGTLSLTGTGSVASSSGVDINASGANFAIAGTAAGATIKSLSGVSGALVTLGAQTLTLSNALSSFAGAIGGSGGLTLTAGTQTLSGTNAYTGATNVNGGGLFVNGSIASSSALNINSGFVGGTGTLAPTTVASGGTLAPGNSIGTINVQGNLTFNAGSTYRVEFSPTDADRTNATGTGQLNGGTVQAVALPGSFTARSYTILNATGGVTGTFGSVVLSGATLNSQASRASLNYDANNVYLVLAPGTLQLPNGTPGNVANVAGGINNAVLNGATPPAGFDTLLNLSGTALTNALSQVSGEGGHGSTQTTAYMAANQFINTLLDLSGGTGGGGFGGASGYAAEEDSDALAYARKRKATAPERDAYAAVTPRDARANFDARWSVWAAGYGGSGTVSGDAAAGTQATRSSVYGTAVGADYRLSRDTVFGVAMGGGGTNFSTAQGLGSGRADLFQLGAYGRHNFGAAYVAGALTYGWQDVTTDRTVTVAGTDRLRANFKTSTFAARTEAGYRYATALMGVTPYAALQATAYRLPSYAEAAVSGSNQFALAFASQTTTNVRSELGLRGDKAFAVADGTLTLRGRVAWAHDSNTDRPVTPTFQSLPGSSFTITGAKPAADGTLVTAGAEMKWRSGWSVAGSFEGEFSRTTDSYAGKGAVRYAW